MPGYTSDSRIGVAGENHYKLPKNNFQLEGFLLSEVVDKNTVKFVKLGPPSDRVEILNVDQDETRVYNEAKISGQLRRGTREINSLVEQTIGYVPIQILNLLLEELELNKHTNVGTALYVRDEACEDSSTQYAYIVHEE